MPITPDLELHTKIMPRLRAAALDGSPVTGWTHCFYKYPARFSPPFVAAAIEEFSGPGDVVLDPFVGGGTTVVEAYVRGRASIGSDLNSLAAFVSRTKTTFLPDEQCELILDWAENDVRALSCRSELEPQELPCPTRSRNLNAPAARYLKKVIALALSRIPAQLDRSAEDFLRCVILSVAQWALDGAKKSPTAEEFRIRIHDATIEMLASLQEYQRAVSQSGLASTRPIILHEDAGNLPERDPFAQGKLADLIVTSPPYPGTHVLYHRWQVDGRKETPAPYWITASQDGRGGSYYTFGHHQSADRIYFLKLTATLRAIRKVVRRGAFFVQTVAFQNPALQLRKYLTAMERADFVEVRTRGKHRIRRPVPGRKWHASQKGATPASQEVVLIHQAV